jgi:Arc/MetJ-type ribon-helix-helix transcriptional regulator
MPRGPRITIRLTPELEPLVSDYVRQGGTVSDLVRAALEAYLGVRQTPRQTSSAAASPSAAAASDTTSDTLSDIRAAALSDVSDIRKRLALLEQQVAELSDRVRQSRLLSDTQEILAMPVSHTSDSMSDALSDVASDTLSDRASDTRQTSRPTPEARSVRPAAAGLPANNIPPFDTSKFVLGPLCKKHHDYHGTGQTLRRVTSHGCPQCDVERTRAKRKATRDGPPAGSARRRATVHQRGAWGGPRRPDSRARRGDT